MNKTCNDFWQGRPTFVTGATGFLGGWLVRRLLDLGADVVCLIRDWVPQSQLVRTSQLFDQVKVVHGDVQDRALLERALGEYEIDTVMHLAAQAIVGSANRNPVATFETNIGGTWSLLEACRHSSKVRRIVIASSDKAYGAHERLPYEEEVPLQGYHPYDVSKSCADLIAQAYAKTYDLPVVITRCGNFYGGGDLNWNRIVPGTIRSVLQGQRPVIRSDGNYMRDYLYVQDGAIVYTTLVEHLAENPDLRGHAFNFSNELNITVLELVKYILALMGSDLEPEVLNYASNEIRYQHLSSAKAKKMLSWSPSFNLNTGLTETIAWYREFLHSKPRIERDDYLVSGVLKV